MGEEVLIFACADLGRDKISSLLLTELARVLRLSGVTENGWRLAGTAGKGETGAGTMKTKIVCRQMAEDTKRKSTITLDGGSRRVGNGGEGPVSEGNLDESADMKKRRVVKSRVIYGQDTRVAPFLVGVPDACFWTMGPNVNPQVDGEPR